MKAGMLRFASKEEVIWGIVLILAGACISVLFVFTDGNGRPVLPVICTVAVGLLITGLVSLFMARRIRSRRGAILCSILLTDFIFVFIVLCGLAFSGTVEPHFEEAVILGPIVMVVYTAPMVCLSATGFVLLAASNRVL